MFIQKYCDYKLEPVVAKKYVSSIPGAKPMHTVDIGSSGKDLWKYFMKLGRSVLKGKENLSEITLTGNNYNIKPIKDKEGNTIKDKKGNIRYRIEEDNGDSFKNDMILFIELPNKNYTDVTYSIDGSASIIAEAYVGKEREEVVYKSPALVLEITGDFILSYQGIDQHGRPVNGKFDYNYNDKKLNI